MPIEVRHDNPNAMMAAYAALGRLKQQQAGGPPQDYVNPYALSPQEGASISAKLAASRERVGQKQKAEYGADAFKDTEAGFNWMNPVQIHQTGPDGQPWNLTMYENLGVDPLRTGGFGALGTRETHINDYGNAIDPTSPYARQALGNVVQSRQSGNIDDPTFFMSPTEKEQYAYEKTLGRKQAEQVAQAELQDTYTQKREARAQAVKTAAARGEYGALEAAMGAEGALDSLDPVTREAAKKIQNSIASIKSKVATKDLEEQYALPVMKDLQKQLLKLLKPEDQWIDDVVTDPNTGQQIAIQRNSTTGQTRVIGSRSRAPNMFGDAETFVGQDGAKYMRQTDSSGRVHNTRIEAAPPRPTGIETPGGMAKFRMSVERFLQKTDPFTGEKINPDPDEVDQYIRQHMGIDPDTGKPVGAHGSGASEADPVKLEGLPDQQAQAHVNSLPSGAYFTIDNVTYRKK